MNTEQIQAEKTVATFYDGFDIVCEAAGFQDQSDGIYNGDPTTPYDQAQENQLSYLLDQIDCKEGSRILDIGCGNGNLLRHAQKRGATAIGITLSPVQVQRCCNQALDVRLLNYRDIGDGWNHSFDAIIANGSVEHFAQVVDAAEGRMDEIYREFFRICHRLINPASHSRKIATTTIHFGNFTADAKVLLKGRYSFRWGSPNFHYRLVARTFGGFNPVSGQLERCAEPCFKLQKEVDGTYDYYLTSKDWLRRGIHGMYHWKTAPRFWYKTLFFFLHHPRCCIDMFLCIPITQSWNWQFRGKNAPMKLLRQTWEYQPCQSTNP